MDEILNSMLLNILKIQFWLYNSELKIKMLLAQHKEGLVLAAVVCVSKLVNQLLRILNVLSKGNIRPLLLEYFMTIKTAYTELRCWEDSVDFVSHDNSQHQCIPKKYYRLKVFS